MTFSLAGKTALVTGAATGIGRAIGIALGQAGATVIVNHLGRLEQAQQTVALIAATGAKAWAIEANVADAASVTQMVEAVLQRHDALDILVNNAGILLETPFLDTSEAEWDQVINTDLKSVFLCCRAVLPSMLSHGSGCIINIASELGYLGRAGFTAYTTAKAGVITLTLGRVGRPEEIGGTAVFLASEQASFYCGQTLSPNGGALMA
ncbi:MAG: short-chain dehydrogenase [Thiomonas sp. 14-64-326]|nr:MAG: short-chain dehydrogenase [Thiomonas sp. 14-64-326]